MAAKDLPRRRSEWCDSWECSSSARSVRGGQSSCSLVSVPRICSSRSTTAPRRNARKSRTGSDAAETVSGATTPSSGRPGSAGTSSSVIRYGHRYVDSRPNGRRPTNRSQACGFSPLSANTEQLAEIAAYDSRKVTGSPTRMRAPRRGGHQRCVGLSAGCPRGSTGARTSPVLHTLWVVIGWQHNMGAGMLEGDQYGYYGFQED